MVVVECVQQVDYGPMIRGSSAQRRNIVCNATGEAWFRFNCDFFFLFCVILKLFCVGKTALSRATGGRGLLLCSNVSRLIDARPPKDVLNLAQFMLGITSSNRLHSMIDKLPDKLVEVCLCSFDLVWTFFFIIKKMKLITRMIKDRLSLLVFYQSSRVEKFMNSKQSMWSTASPSHDVNEMIEKLKESCNDTMEVDEP